MFITTKLNDFASISSIRFCFSLAWKVLLQFLGNEAMEHKQTIYEALQTEKKQKKQAQAWSLEKVHNQRRYYDGKIFYAADKVTYTFMFEEEVVVLHFDRDRQALFFKGHRVESLNIHPNISEFLTEFRRLLEENPQTKEFLGSFDVAVGHLK